MAVPYAAAVGATIATQAWNAPSSGLDNPSVIIMQCRKAGDLRIKIVANQTDPTPRGSAGFLQALSPNINVRFTLGTDTSNSSMWMNTTGTGNTTTIPNTIPDVADIGGGPLNPSLASANFTSQPAGRNLQSDTGEVDATHPVDGHGHRASSPDCTAASATAQIDR